MKLEGLTRRQHALATIIWEIQDLATVKAFVASLPEDSQRDAKTVIELMMAEFMDQTVAEDTDLELANQVIDSIR